MNEEQDVDALTRRGRRRLIGAIALVLLAVLILPMVFDPEPGPTTSSVQVRIPGEGDGSFSPKGEPSRPATGSPANKADVAEGQAKMAAGGGQLAAASQPAALAASALPHSVAAPASSPSTEVALPTPVAAPKDIATPRVADPKTAQRARPGEVTSSAGTSVLKRESATPPIKQGFVVQIAAFASAEKLNELTVRLKAENITYFTETVATTKGKVTRVRAGPFESKEAADKVRERLVKLGLKPGNSIPREG